MEVITIPKSVLKELTTELDELLPRITEANKAYVGIFDEERRFDNHELSFMLVLPYVHSNIVKTIAFAILETEQKELL
ncbi:hypothetical protein BEI02_15675 [Elizabethkingia sp. HvH-WGS333]|uniref:Uncharacterized protein n=1 Tax=Elizabethkingia anophelis TaxID=1117645 RepID=A0A455ZGI4_9FLAO|nr:MULTISPECIES: hypothetical protein [Elizabethkingia]MCL1641502.1 hypothetical protein [Elizabethkingia anophelis]MCL1646313.1 hypothetical protein [Elizabethkingia anophelis]MDV3473054.1 hypothetical protein [Elizabethkingia anophelis]OIK46325.1 hypothetical protein BEI02_15675 [Elizabethkingia sp. HvH-WGS333]DAC75879.1 TPA_exp: hypothetical protein [Elizabethkingia anophelis]